MVAISTFANHSVLLAVGIAATGAHAASSADNFRACFTWDAATNGFQGGAQWYESQPCKEWFWQAFGFTIPAVIGVALLLLFPFLFCAARVCCNCCGGRHPNDAICCADKASRERHAGYSNCSILTAKLTLVAVVAAYTALAVAAYVDNARLHNDVLHSMHAIDDSVDTVSTLVTRTGTAVDALAGSSNTLAQQSLNEYLKEAKKAIAKGSDAVHKVFSQIRNVEDNQAYGRQSSVYRYVSCVLVCLLLAVLFMLCNFRMALAPLLALVCVTSVVEGCVFIPHMILAQGASAACSSYDQTVVPIVIGVIAKHNGCSDTTILSGLDVVAAEFEGLVTDSSTSLCGAMRTVCSAKRCVYNTCGGPTGATVSLRGFSTADPYNAAAFAKIFTTPFEGESYTMVDCAGGTGCTYGGDAQKAASKLVAFYHSEFPDVEYLLDTAYPAMNNCGVVRAQLDGPLREQLCDRLDRDATRVATLTGVLFLLSFFAVFAIVRGMKRFRRLGDQSRAGEHVAFLVEGRAVNAESACYSSV